MSIGSACRAPYCDDAAEPGSDLCRAHGRRPDELRAHAKPERHHGVPHHKRSFYFPETMFQEMHADAIRLDRSLSWVVRKAWELAKVRLAAIPEIEAFMREGEPK